MTFTYSGNPLVSDVAAVRFEIHDTDVNAQLLQDEEIQYAIVRETGQAANLNDVALTDVQLWSAGARCMESLSEMFAAQADTTFGSLQVQYTTQASQYAQRAAALRAKAQGSQSPWAGGQSVAEKIAYAENQDQVQPQFTRRQFDSRYIGPTTRRGGGI